MSDPDLLRRLALDMHTYADNALRDCEERPACYCCGLVAETYRSLAHDFHQRALKTAMEVDR